jgi:5-hydroxyisourate hydrolase
VPAGRALRTGVHRLRFEIDAYFNARGMAGFYPEVTVVFEVADPSEHYHVPLLLSPYGYTTYRGS